MKCKCRNCQTSLDTQDAYMAMLGKQKAYFCNEEHYNLFLERMKQEKIEKEEERQRKKEERRLNKENNASAKDRAYYLICEIIERKNIVNPILWKEWKVWNKVATNETIEQFLEENKEYLCKAMARIGNVEQNRIKYLSTVLKSRLGDYKPVKKATKQVIPVVQEEHYETKFKSKKRKSLEDLEEDCDE